MASPCKSFTLCSMNSSVSFLTSKQRSRSQSQTREPAHRSVRQERRDSAEEKQHYNQAGDEPAAGALGAMRTLEPLVKKPHVPLIRLVRRIEHIARKGNDAHEAVERHVERHAGKHAAAHAQPVRFRKDVARKEHPD